MSSSVSTKSVLTISALTAVGGLIAYAAYFDYKRRNDAAFRKQLKKDKKRVARSTPDKAGAGTAVSIESIKQALETLREEQLPETVPEKEQYFMDNVQMGETLCTQGPLYHLVAALAFYRALRVYPSPVELIMIYQKTVPEPVFNIVMQMTTLDVKQHAEGYYNAFPGSSYDVSVLGVASSDAALGGQKVVKNVLTADKDFKAGEVLYKEQPLVALLDYDLEGKGTHCSQCFRAIGDSPAIRMENDPLDSAYCSEECKAQAGSLYHALLFGSSSEAEESQSEERRAAQKRVVDFYKESTKANMLLVCMFIARIVAESTRKLSAGSGTSLPSGGREYTLVDHMERLRYLEFSEESWEDQKKMVADLLREAAQGLQEFVQDDKYGVFLGKMAYNAIGVVLDDGRTERPESPLRPEDQEYTRTPSGANTQVGSGLYLVSSYLQHSCAPNTRPAFVKGTNELHLVAERDIKKGEELSMAYVQVNGPSATPEEVVATRRNRRMALARGWRFACTCDRCAQEAPQPAAEASTGPSDDIKIEGPGAQLETSAMRFETGEGEADFRSKETHVSDVE